MGNAQHCTSQALVACDMCDWCLPLGVLIVVSKFGDLTKPLKQVGTEGRTVASIWMVCPGGRAVATICTPERGHGHAPHLQSSVGSVPCRCQT